MAHEFLEVRPGSWERASALGKRLTAGPSRHWIFRGQADARWGLETSLERVWRSFGHQNELQRREAWMLHQFRRRAHHHLATTPGDRQFLEWLALMQHHGAPSRLLDFSYSFYVATAFAVESFGQDAAVWAINMALLRECTRERVGARGATIFSYLRACSRHVDEMLGFPGWKPDELGCTVLCAEPSRLNERISSQKGLFVVPTEIERPFEANLASAFGHDADALELQRRRSVGPDVSGVAAIKIVLSKKIAPTILGDLKEMNLTHATLFPGIDGFARSLRAKLAQPWSNWTDEDDDVLEGSHVVG